MLYMNLSNPKHGHTTGGSGRSRAQRCDGAARGCVERDAVGSIRPGDNPPSCTPANGEYCPERLFGSKNSLTCRVQNPDILRASPYGAARGRTAGAGVNGQHKTPTTRIFAQENQTLLPPRRWKNDLLGVPLEAGINEILCKHMEKQNLRWNRGSTAVYQQFISRTRSDLCSWLLTSEPTPLCLCKPFLCKTCPGIRS